MQLLDRLAVIYKGRGPGPLKRLEEVVLASTPFAGAVARVTLALQAGRQTLTESEQIALYRPSRFSCASWDLLRRALHTRVTLMSSSTMRRVRYITSHARCLRSPAGLRRQLLSQLPPHDMASLRSVCRCKGCAGIHCANQHHVLCSFS